MARRHGHRQMDRSRRGYTRACVLVPSLTAQTSHRFGVGPTAVCTADAGVFSSLYSVRLTTRLWYGQCGVGSAAAAPYGCCGYHQDQRKLSPSQADARGGTQSRYRHSECRHGALGHRLETMNRRKGSAQFEANSVEGGRKPSLGRSTWTPEGPG
ncbi:hypothetical protein CERSUDRAFT_114810 [Gelatoporia subvermispora B]|uniref:Uncharacterized protein n=1 Tax=Ceriporiopsis subvermispora (strain B) TaxID=914234 RepID=M2QIP4_CERS8|nr:hypothetical protein CERSUDRAFT_114810 [Gelatoporia subvermispora B]